MGKIKDVKKLDLKINPNPKYKSSIRDYIMSEEGITVVSQWKRNGATDMEICEKLNINKITLYRWKKENEDLCTALKISREIADTKLEAKLYSMAMEGQVVPMIFLVKNRMSDKYRDVQAVDMNLSAGAEVAKAFRDITKKVDKE